MTEPGDPDLEHIAPLEADNIPDANQSHFCFSCAAPMTGLYCAACGQKNDDYRRSLFGLGWEAISSMFALEHRLWRTWWNLFRRPGRVAREYVHGRRSYWSSPVRVYLFTSIFLFTFLALTKTQIFGFDVSVEQVSGFEKTQAELTDEDYSLRFKVLSFKSQKYIDQRNASKDFELITRKLDGIFTGLDDDFRAIQDEQTSSEPDSAEKPSPPIRPIDDGSSISLTGADGKTRIFTGSDFSAFMILAAKNPSFVNSALQRWLPRIMFFMMPLAMLIGAVFIRGKNALLYDHLVHAAYIHAVAFVVIFALILLSPIIIGELYILLGFFFIYLPLSIKHMFGRGWFKSILTAYSVAAVYLFIMASIVITLTIWSTTQFILDQKDLAASVPGPQTTIVSPPSPQIQPPQ